MVDDMIDGVKNAAAKIGEIGDDTAGAADSNKLYERIVPIPQVDTYSELPFALVEKGGVRDASGTRPKAAASQAKPTTRAAASSSATKRSTKKTTKKTAKRKTKT